MERVDLGDRVKDRITGYTGIAHCMTKWLNGCIRFAVQPEQLDKDGKVVDDRYFDEGQLIVIKKGVHKVVEFVPAPEVVQPIKEEVKERRLSSGGPDRESGNFRPQMSTNNVR